MESVVKIAAIAVSAALCAVVVKKQVPEIAFVLSLFCGVIILLFALPALKSIRQLMDTLWETAGIAAAVLVPVIKTTGIAIVTKVTSEICKDAKEGAIASFLEIAGAAGAIYVCLPLIEMVLNMVTGLL